MADLQPDNPATNDAHDPWETLDGAEAVAGLQDADVSDEPSEAEPAESSDESIHEEVAVDEEPASDEPVEGEPAVVTGSSQVTAGSSSIFDEDDDSTAKSTGGWTITALCVGLALLACAVLIPAADANRRLAYERQTLRQDLETVEKQIAVNQEFVRRVGQDPTLAERLARRQMKVIPVGNKVLDLPSDGPDTAMSPFQLTTVPKPEPLPPYKPIGGFIASVCYDSHARLYLIGTALVMVAVGLVLGGSQGDE